MSITRRSLLGATATAGVLAATGLPAFAAPAAGQGPAKQAAKAAGQRLLSTLADNGKVALPQGFRAWRVGTIGVEDLLSDRNGSPIGTTPSKLDGTGAFDYAGGIRLVRNHECRADTDVTVPLVAGTVYDAGIATGMGGNTVVELDASGRFKQQWVALSGTIRNCAGGETPWGSWLACEEDTTKAGTEIIRGGKSWGTTQKDHGYVFEVFPDVVAQQSPLPIKAWGRAVWEGAAIDPDLTKAYITEDTGRGLLYRWTAPEGTKLGAYIAEQFGENDGVLQAAQVIRNGVPLVHYGQLTADDVDQAYPVKWVDGGEDRQAQTMNLRDQYPGATQHPKVEGCWPDAEGLWFTLSFTNQGQIDSYRKSHGIDMPGDWGMIGYYRFADETITIKDHYAKDNTAGGVVPGDATEDVKQFHGPDNITVNSRGLVVITEDGNNPCSMLAMSHTKKSVEFARDLADRGEWAGPCFNKSGTMLFSNIQGDCTYAITGPFNAIL